jgi:S-adenosylmethionine:tRNA ribosyltransferase-isomerase
MSEVYKLSKFEFPITEDFVPLMPPAERGLSRMMVVNKTTGTIEHKKFRDIIDYFDEGDLMLINDT